MKSLLDMKCAKKGYDITHESDDVNLLRKSLGILQEDGIYAFFLFLKFKKKDNVAKVAYNFFNENKILEKLLPAKENTDDILYTIRTNLADNLDHLLFVKDILERILIYALYHARSKKEQNATDTLNSNEVVKEESKE